jgi:nitric oxide reductase subunit C
MVSVTQSAVKDGLQLYQEQGCGNCHQLDVAEAQGTLGPPHNGIATTAEARIHVPDYTGTATTPAEYLRESIVNPGVYLVPGYNSPRLKMAAFTNLSEAEVDALVQFLLQQK